MSGFIAWVGIAVAHYRFRRAFKAQGKSLDAIPYKASLFPFGPLFAFTICIIVMLGQNYGAFIGDEINWYDIAVSYIGIPVFLLTYLGYKWVKGSELIPLEEVDLSREWNLEKELKD